MLIEVLARVIDAAGGAQALDHVRDLTQSGEITFHWGDGVKGPVTVQTLGANHFRMEADLPEGKRVWLVNDGSGTRKEADRTPVPLSNDNAVNLANLTFPITAVAAALADNKTDVSLVGIEKKDGRSIYRVRLKGRLGLIKNSVPSPTIVKDLIVDALNFRILSVEDRPFQTYEAGGKRSDKPTRVIEFDDLRTVDGVLVPFSIGTKLLGQPLLSIHLSSVVFNNNLGTKDFEN
jgi:hypothetical protein